MNGQWMGKYTATNAAGDMVVEVDDLGDCFAGRAYAYPADARIPHAVGYFKTVDKKRNSTTRAEFMPIDPRRGEIALWPTIANQYPGTVFASDAKVEFKWTNNTLSLKWSTNIHTTGTAELSKSDAGKPSEYVPDRMEWDEFKRYVGELDYRRYIFRGQKRPWRLRTNYHRTGRADLARYLAEDIPSLHRHLSARTRHLFDRRNPDENGAFLHMVQHHGYPTPLLDWTYSPFVAAFFAYRGIGNSEAGKAKDSDHVRIFQFDRDRWIKSYNQVQKLTPAMPHFSVMEFVAVDNERMIPQQALSGLTNVDDVESYIRAKELPDNPYLKVIDIPWRDRARIMRDLSTMGITSGSLFPGLDGTCEEMRERFFSS